MPRITRGAEHLSDVLVYLTTSEASELQRALGARLERREGYQGPAWHCHIADAEAELSVGVFDDDVDEAGAASGVGALRDTE
jgi:hypothetical protein